MTLKNNYKGDKCHEIYKRRRNYPFCFFFAFNGMKRKKEDIALSFHSIMVGNMLKNIGCDEQTIYIRYLHDIIEDTKYDYEFLSDKYGREIADGVLMLSEDKDILDYVQRKEKFIVKLKNAPENILMI